MKLLRLTTQNMTSLVGEVCVDLEAIRSQTNLFAITGETGSGKSTLLNAISLALFGKTYKSELIQTDYISTDASSGSCSVEFEHEKKIYLAKWQGKIRKKNGELLVRPQTQRFLEHNGSTLDTTVEELVGLSFKQFTKTTMINQGVFDEFIKSRFPDRKKLLESFFDHLELDKLSKNLYKKLHESKQELEHHSQTIHILSEGQHSTPKLIETQLKQLQASIKRHNKSLSQKQGQLKLAQEALKQQEEFQAYQSTLGQLEDQRIKLLASQQQLTQLLLVENKTLTTDKELVSSLKTDLIAAHPIFKSIAEIKVKLSTKVEQSSEWSDQKKIIVNKTKLLMAQAESMQDKLKNFSHSKLDQRAKELESFKDHVYEIEKLKTQLVNIENQIIQITETQTRLPKYDSKSFEQLDQILKKENINEKQVNESQVLIQKEITLYNSKLAHLQEQICQINTELEQLPQLTQQLERAQSEATNSQQQELDYAIHLVQKHSERQCLACHSSIEGLSLFKDGTRAEFGSYKTEILKLKVDQLHLQKKKLQQLLEEEKSLKEKITQTEDSEKITLRKHTTIKLNIEKLTEQLSELKSLKARIEDYSEQKIKNKNKLSRLNEQKVDLSAQLTNRMAQTQGIDNYKLLDNQIHQNNKTLELFKQQLFIQEQLKELNVQDLELEKKLKKSKQSTKQDQEQIQILTKSLRPGFNLEQTNRDINALDDAIEKRQDLINQQQIELTVTKEKLSANEKEQKKLKQMLCEDKVIEVSFDLELLQSQLKQLEDQTTKNSLHLGELKQQLKQSIQVSAQIDELKQKQKILWQRLKILENIDQVIGKDLFRNYVLAQVEQQLVALTNNELENLCGGRFRVVQRLNPQTQYADFYVIDSRNNFNERKISTLSGGETFMVSIAMALALSTLASGVSTVDFLFIDEGFGTLDDDSLEEVVSMLQELRLRGKTVGIISHIKKLTQRLELNLKVKRIGPTHSKVELVQN